MCDLVGAEIQRFADVAQGADMDREIPTCPGWSMGKLIRHVGTVHRWAGTMVAAAAQERMDARALDLALPEHPSWLPGWLASGGDELVERLRRADPDRPMWAWGADQHARFWPRRMLHETLIHRADAELALGEDHPVEDPAIAADGIDELFTNLPSAAAFSPDVAELKGTGSFGIVGDDASWVVRLREDGFDVTRAGPDQVAEADAQIRGATAELLLLLYRRRAPDSAEVEVSGERPLVEKFWEHAALQ